MKVCVICAGEFDEKGAESMFAEAGEWLAEEVWNDGGLLCPRCLESRATLVMMYGHDVNT
jgi:hypothetical protein